MRSKMGDEHRHSVASLSVDFDGDTRPERSVRGVGADAIPGVRRASIAFAGIVLLTTIACGKKHGGLTLSDQVFLECSGLVTELELAADDYDKFATWVRTNNVTQDQLVERDGQLPPDPVLHQEYRLPYGWSHEVRGPAALQLFKRLVFCKSIRLGNRGAYSHVLDFLAASFFQTFDEAWSPDDAAHVLRSISMVARQISDQPIVE